MKQLAAEYGERVSSVEDSTDVVQLQQAFSIEIAWFNKQTADAVEQLKDKSLKRTAHKAINKFIDLVCLSFTSISRLLQLECRQNNGTIYMALFSGDGL